MANPDHLARLKKGVQAWNAWREAEQVRPDLRRADLSLANLQQANLMAADLRGANLTDADLAFADLHAADLEKATLQNACLHAAYLGESNLREANLSGANLWAAFLSRAALTGANFDEAKMGCTCLGDLDLSCARNLETIEHRGPSTVGIDTIYESNGKIPVAFLRGCGVPDNVIDYLPSLLNQPIQFYSCFISYSTNDQAFADRLYADLQLKGIRCWFARHDLESGKKLHVQIDEAIRRYEKLLLVLSPSSMASNWVKTEIANARKREQAEGIHMLHPIGLASFEEIRAWQCFDADIGIDLAREIREYYIPDFSNWETNHDGYLREFTKLLKALTHRRTAAAAS